MISHRFVVVGDSFVQLLGQPNRLGGLLDLHSEKDTHTHTFSSSDQPLALYVRVCIVHPPLQPHVVLTDSRPALCPLDHHPLQGYLVCGEETWSTLVTSLLPRLAKGTFSLLHVCIVSVCVCVCVCVIRHNSSFSLAARCVWSVLIVTSTEQERVQWS